MDKCREEFEAEFSKVSNRLLNKYKTQNDNERYIDNFVEAVFIGWKLSRESLKTIKLPEELMPECEGDRYKSRYDAAYCIGYNEALRLVDDSITSAGYKVE